MTPEELDKLEESAKYATPGPWCVVLPNDRHQIVIRSDKPKRGRDYVAEMRWPINDTQDNFIDDADFIATANPQTILSLIAQVRRYRKALEFYAEPFTWVSNSGKVGINPIDFDGENIPGTAGAHRFCSGRKARNALKEAE